MELPSYFGDFLKNIRPQSEEKQAHQTAHSTLRDKLHSDEAIQKVLVTTFLQGSYRRHTALKAAGNERSDIDIVVVTKIDRKDSPTKALEYFEPFCEKHYPKKWKRNDRSIGITLDEVSLDLVVTAAPSEAEQGLLKSAAWVQQEDLPIQLNEKRLVKGWVALGGPMRFDYQQMQRIENASKGDWKGEPLLIPDRKFEKWEETHPLAQIEWTWEKNLACNGHYVNVVKALKWWKRIRPDELPKYPKGYPIEHLIGVSCPDDIDTVAEGVTKTLEHIVSNFSSKPVLPDHGVPSHDVMKRVPADMYLQFYQKVKDAAAVAREALDSESIEESAKKWRILFGDEFPEPESDDEDRGGGGPGGFSKRSGGSKISGGERFA